MVSEDELFLDMVVILDNEMNLIIGNYEPIETSSGVTLIYFPETNTIYNPETGQSFNLTTTNVTPKNPTNLDLAVDTAIRYGGLQIWLKFTQMLMK